MISARIAFNVHSPINYPLHNPQLQIFPPPFFRFAPAKPFPDRLRGIQILFCAENQFDSPCGDDSSNRKIAAPPGCNSVKAATWVGVATLTSKILGLLREVTMASVFGVGPVVSAFKYAWVLPGFSSSLLGGVNGPIHIIMATTLSKLPKERGKKLFLHLTTIMFLIGGVAGALVYIFPELILRIYAPGLWILVEGKIIREMAMDQLKIMAPCIVLAGPVGLGFGYMSAEGNNALPSISPAFSSSLLIVGCLIHTFSRRLNAPSIGGKIVAVAVSLGLFLQWIIQATVLRTEWSSIFLDSLSNIVKSRDVCEFFSLLLPATVSSGLAQIASFTDLCFASLIPGAAAGLSYAYLMVMAPLGALSSIIVLPLVATFSKQTSSWDNLVDNLERALLLSMVLLLPIFSVMRILAEPIIHVLFQRFAFDSSASALVSDVFLAYSLGAPFFITKDVLVAAFYALGDGKGPFLVSAGAVALNAFLDWLSVSRFNLGAKGLALSTSFTAAASTFILFHLLKRKLPGIANYTDIFYPTTLLLFCCLISNLATSATYKLMCQLLSSSTFFSRHHLMKALVTASIAGCLGIVSFFVPVIVLHLSGFKIVRDLYKMLIQQQSLRPMAKSHTL
ncbi:hypothetical protein ACP275_11G132500 [Erythranthe tilingii]